jgi:DNA-directed RNA polymerase subunit RPC12/RpoP
MKKLSLNHILLPFFFCAFTLFAVRPVLAQDDQELHLRLNRDFGYGSFGGNQIQGNFSMTITGPQDLARVVFYLDDQVMGEDNEAPFSLRFVTDNYDLGVHALQATGTNVDGRELQSNVIRTEFVSAGEGTGAALKIVGLAFGVIFGGMGIAFLFSNVLGKGKKTDLPLGAPRRYGVLGGAICPKCSRPFAVHVYGLKLIVARFDRCPYCGKWSFIRRASPEELKQAEAAELEWATPEQKVTAEKTETDLLKDLEDSRYQDL